MQIMAKEGKTATVFLPGTPSGVTGLMSEIRNMVMTAEAGKPA
jgi:uncharacterized membrane protein